MVDRRSFALLCCLPGVTLFWGCQPGDEAAHRHSTPSYDTSLPMHDLMTLVLDPAADIIWASAGSIVTLEGETDLAPTTAAGWLQVRSGAATIIESANLLLLPGRGKDEDDWREFALGLAAMGHRALRAADSEDAEALFGAGADLYQVCLACHQHYGPGLVGPGAS